MQLIEPSVIAPLFGVFEFALLLARRASGGAQPADERSLSRLWIVILASVAAAFAVRFLLPQAGLALLARARVAGGMLF